MEFAGFFLPPNLLETFDADILEFYYDVISKELDLENRWNISRIKFKLSTSLNDISVLRWKEVQPSTALERCAFILKHGACLTSVIAHNFFKLLAKNPFILMKSMKKRKLKICCLGGGSGIVVVALSKVISVMQNHFWMRTGEALEFSVTIVDKGTAWESTATNVLRILEEKPHLFDSEKISLNFRFIQASLTDPLDSEVQQSIENADVVFILYLIPDIVEKIRVKVKEEKMKENIKIRNKKRNAKGRKKKEKPRDKIKKEKPRDKIKKETEIYSKAMQEIFEHIKVGTLIFFLDCPSTSSYEIINDIIQRSEDFNEVYAQVEQVHLMSINAAKKHFELWVNNFWSLTQTFYFFNPLYWVGAWVKTNKRLKDVKVLWLEALKVETNREKSEKQHTVCMKSESDIFAVNRKARKRNIKKILIYHRRVKKLWFHLLSMDEFAEEEEYESCEQGFINDNVRTLFLTKCKRRRLFSNYGLKNSIL